MTYEQRCPVCGKLTFYVGDAVPGMLCDCHTRQVTYIDWAGESKLLAERDEARRWARRMMAERDEWRSSAITAHATLQERNAEIEAIEYAAHMPADYPHGLPSWINRHLYGRLIEMTDDDGMPIRRTEDIEKMIALNNENARLRAELAALKPDAPQP